MNKTTNPRLAVFPETTRIDSQGHLVIGGCDTLALAEEFGTPLYIYDETDLRSRCREYKTEFGKRYENVTISYSPKAFTANAMLKLVMEEGLDLDIVSGGELGIAKAVGFPMDRVHFPGNNKSPEELKMAAQNRIGHIIVDNLVELDKLIALAGKRKVKILLRLNPGIDPHTHEYNTTGLADSKFGLPRGEWDEAVSKALAAPNLDLDGLHFHIGSYLFEAEPYQSALDVVLKYAAELKKQQGYEMKTLSIGGGIGVRYTLQENPPPFSFFAEKIVGRLKENCAKYKLKLPRLILEPGRSIVARAGVTLYTVGVIKDIPGIRTYASVDGGMSENMRQPMYGYIQEALVAARAADQNTHKYTISGKLCESGDILIKETTLPELHFGNILALAGSGAYAVPMQSNYNSMLRPAIVFVKDGKARLIRRRETVEDLVSRDLD